MPRKKADTAEKPVEEKEMQKEESAAGNTISKSKKSAPETETAAKPSFYDIDYNELDKDLSPDQLKEWTAIYASYRSRTPLSGTVIGVDTHRLEITDPVSKEKQDRQILCLVIMGFRAKVIIPQTEIWYDPDTELPDYVIKRMVGAKTNYVITNVDRLGECAVASRRIALEYARNVFFKDKRRHSPGQILTCGVLVVGPSRIIAECSGFDLHIRNRDLSYTAVADLRDEYHTGQEIKAKLIKADKANGILEASVKEVNPNPFYGADKRHPINSTRKAVISGKYAGGLFCRLSDDTNCLCLYSPSYYSEEFYIGDPVLITITRYDYDRKLIYGKLMSRM